MTLRTLEQSEIRSEDDSTPHEEGQRDPDTIPRPPPPPWSNALAETVEGEGLGDMEAAAFYCSPKARKVVLAMPEGLPDPPLIQEILRLVELDQYEVIRTRYRVDSEEGS